jgi:hypothetical protein
VFKDTDPIRAYGNPDSSVATTLPGAYGISLPADARRPASIFRGFGTARVWKDPKLDCERIRYGQRICLSNYEAAYSIKAECLPHFTVGESHSTRQCAIIPAYYINAASLAWPPSNQATRQWNTIRTPDAENGKREGNAYHRAAQNPPDEELADCLRNKHLTSHGDSPLWRKHGSGAILAESKEFLTALPFLLRSKTPPPT